MSPFACRALAALYRKLAAQADVVRAREIAKALRDVAAIWECEAERLEQRKNE